MKELYIDWGITQSRACVVEKGKMIDLYVENHNNSNLSGNIYLGRVENVVNGLKAAFVNIGTKKNAILHFDDSNTLDILKKGSQLIVQVIREATGDKGPRVTTKISLPGRNIVFLPECDYIGISKKIDSEEVRNKYKSLARGLVNEHGIIIRTEAVYESDNAIGEEFQYLKDRYEEIKNLNKFIKAPKLIFDSRDFIGYISREFVKHGIDRIIVNNEYCMNELINMLSMGKNEFIDKIEHNEFDFRSIKYIKNEMLELFNEKIPLKEGGYIVINESEALVSIDVNSGSYSEGGTVRVNIEACSEIARIIKLRNLSGIIIIDFIDMTSEEDKALVIEELQSRFKDDRSTYKIYGFTKLGLLEISRSRRGKKTIELIYNDINNEKYSTAYILKEIENDCAAKLKYYNKNNIDVYVNKERMQEIKSIYWNFLKEFNEIYKININFIQEDLAEDFILDEKIEDLKKIKISLLHRTIVGELTHFEENENDIIIKINKR